MDVVVVELADILDLVEFARVEVRTLRIGENIGRNQGEVHSRQMQQVADVLQRALAHDRHHTHLVRIEHRRQIGCDTHEGAVDFATHDANGDWLRVGRGHCTGCSGKRGNGKSR